MGKKVLPWETWVKVDNWLLIIIKTWRMDMITTFLPFLLHLTSGKKWENHTFSHFPGKFANLYIHSKSSLVYLTCGKVDSYLSSIGYSWW